MIERNKQKNTAGKPKGYRAWNKGMTLDSSYRKRISEGTKIGMAKPETKEKMKLYYKRFKDSGMFKGDNNPCWRGGTVGYYKQQALIRDHFTCKICSLYDPEIEKL